MAGQNSWSSLPSSVRDRLRAEVFARDGYRCQIRGPNCLVDRKLELDHIVERSRGGAILDMTNCRTACRTCNRGRRRERRRSRRSGSPPRPSRRW